jgi:hypothetical protein
MQILRGLLKISTLTNQKSRNMFHSSNITIINFQNCLL